MKTDLIYGVEDRPPFKDALFAALQHLLAIFVAITLKANVILVLRASVFVTVKLQMTEIFHI